MTGRRVRCASCGKPDCNPSDPTGVRLLEGFSPSASFALCGPCEREYLRLPPAERGTAKEKMLDAAESDPGNFRCDPGEETAVAGLYRRRALGAPLCPGCDEPIERVGGVFSGVGPGVQPTPSVAICADCRNKISAMIPSGRGKELVRCLRKYLRDPSLYDVPQDLLDGILTSRIEGPTGLDH